MLDHIVILTLEIFKPAIHSIMQRFCAGKQYQFVFSKQDMMDIREEVTKKSVLISFGNGFIVPEEVLNQFGAAYNFHPASPEYPGLHPHHFAALDQAKTFGAVCHHMTKEVDRGEIVFCQRFMVPPQSPWMVYLNLSLDQTFFLMEELFETLFIQNKHPKPCGETWGPKVYTKKDFDSACQVPPDMNRENFERLWRSLQTEHHKNVLYIDMHGHRFRYEKESVEDNQYVHSSRMENKLN